MDDERLQAHVRCLIHTSVGYARTLLKGYATKDIEIVREALKQAKQQDYGNKTLVLLLERTIRRFEKQMDS